MCQGYEDLELCTPSPVLMLELTMYTDKSATKISERPPGISGSTNEGSAANKRLGLSCLRVFEVGIPC